MKIIVIAIAFLMPAGVLAQDPGEELINWSGSRKLTWADYKARPDLNSDAAATTTTYLVFSYNLKENDFSFQIESKFSRTRSWGLHKTAHILAHEQGHFDIAEIFARKLYKKLKEYSFNKRTFKTDLRTIYQDILDEKENFQNNYDRETNHSINKEKQAEWLKRIDALLKEYDAYAGYQNKP